MTLRASPLRAFPVLHARDVEALAAFYGVLGFEVFVTLPGEDGRAGYIGLRRDEAEMAITDEAAPRVLAGVQLGAGPRNELFVYVRGLDAVVGALRGAGGHINREPADMPWGERLAFVADPEGNLISLAEAPA